MGGWVGSKSRSHLRAPTILNTNEYRGAAPASLEGLEILWVISWSISTTLACMCELTCMFGPSCRWHRRVHDDRLLAQASEKSSSFTQRSASPGQPVPTACPAGLLDHQGAREHCSHTHLPGAGRTKTPAWEDGSRNRVSACSSSLHASFKYKSTDTKRGLPGSLRAMQGEGVR